MDRRHTPQTRKETLGCTEGSGSLHRTSSVQQNSGPLPRRRWLGDLAATKTLQTEASQQKSRRKGTPDTVGVEKHVDLLCQQVIKNDSGYTTMEGDKRQPVKYPWMLKNPSELYCSSGHSQQALFRLNEQRRKGLFCDIVLVSDGERFVAHRNILAVCSSYLNTVFTSGMQESYQKEVNLVGTSAIGCKAVLDFLYGEKILLDSQNVHSVLKTAHLLQIWKLVNVSCEYLESDLNTENYLQLQELASAYNLKRLDLSIDYFVLKNFGGLCFTPEFVEKISVEKLCLYLDSDHMELKVEHELLKLALQWLSHCPERAKDSHHVLENIRFSLIAKRDLINLSKSAERSLLPLQTNCQSFIDEAIHYHDNYAAQPVLQNRWSTLRADGECLVFLGGEIEEKEDWTDVMNMEQNSSVFFLEPARQKWMLETQVPAWRGCCCVAVLGNFIFCAGGFTLYGGWHCTSNMVFRYDPRWTKWAKVATMNQGRHFFSLTALEDKLIAVGGFSNENIFLDSVEIYYPQKDFWSFVEALPRPSYSHAGSAYKQRVYITGGVSNLGSGSMNTLLCYDCCTGLWEKKKDMSTARRYHNMCTLDDCIYVIGGEEIPIKSVECYSPVCDQWTRVAPLTVGISHSGVAVWRGEIYVLGGMQHTSNMPSKMVQVYDQEKNIWYRGPDLQSAVTGVSGCVCILKK